MFADATTGAWPWSADGGWFGGFWPGLLWLAEAATGERRYAELARESAERLGGRVEAPTVLRGFLFWYGVALGPVLWPGRRERADLAVAAARSLAADFDPIGGLLPPGAEDVRSYGWPRPGACVDGLPGTVALLAFASERTGDDGPRETALAHARAHLAFCVREDHSVAQTATYDENGRLVGRAARAGSSTESTWSRAQAWTALGLAQAAHLAGAEFTEPARHVADWYVEHAPADGVCYWDFDDPAIPDAPRDTSAAAITASALLKLAALGEPGYRSAAEHIVDSLVGRHLGPHGGLRDGCYSMRKGIATRNELVWGDYFLLEALLALDGSIDPATL
jgi:unsaturated chondroitin disaccharide hydrolase